MADVEEIEKGEEKKPLKVIRYDRPKKMGRPTKYDAKRHPKLALAVAHLGGTDEESADLLDINVLTLYRWKRDYPDFCKAIESGKDAQDTLVENLLLKKAKGYTTTEEKVFMYEGQPSIVVTEKVYPPDPKALQFWLTNRRGKYWKERHEVHVDTDITLNFDKEDKDL